jgi:hypothetical protein
MTVLANEAQSSMEVRAPADGTVLTENPALLVDQDVGGGQPLLALAGGAQVVRIFIPISALNRISPDSELTLAIPGRFSMLHLKLPPPDADPVPLPPGLVPSERYQGITLPVFYTSRMPLPGGVADSFYGISGPAKIFGARRSLAGRVAKTISDVVKAHVW